MKQKILIVLGAFGVILLILTWLVFGAATQFEGKSKYIYIRDGKDAKMQIQSQLEDNPLIRSTNIFYFICNQLDVWERVKSGQNLRF